jgi:nicotinamide mononucleotide transporter
MIILDLLDINKIFFTFIGYPMSYIEFVGTIFTIACVWLTTKGKVLSWPVGIIGTILYLILFYQINLYSDVIEQIYFLFSGFLGWWIWIHPKKKDANAKNELKVSRNTPKENLIYLGIIILGTALLTFIVSHLDRWFPIQFPEAASLPLLDSFTTVLSFVAQWLLVRKKVESWILWIIVDVIAVGLYWFKDVKFISIEYLLFCVLATMGLLQWLKQYRNEQKGYAQNT